MLSPSSDIPVGIGPGPGRKAGVGDQAPALVKNKFSTLPLTSLGGQSRWCWEYQDLGPSSDLTLLGDAGRSLPISEPPLQSDKMCGWEGCRLFSDILGFHRGAGVRREGCVQTARL